MTSVMTAPQPQRVEVPARREPLADASMLEDKVPEALKASRLLAYCTVLLGLVFVFFSYRPLWHTDLWGHLAYGRLIATGGSLPATEPLMPLAKGVSFVDTAWLSQVVGYFAIQRLGITAIGFLNALSITVMAALVLYSGYRRSRNVPLALAGLGLWLWGCWQHLTIVRPQLAGMLCFLLLFALLTTRRRRAWHWIAVPTLFAAWANLHGSFPVGLLLLAGFAAGRSLDLAVRCGEFRAVQRDSQVRRHVLMLELAAAAVLLNPYGVRLYAEVLNISNNPNVADLVEWAPLSLRMWQGQAVALTGLLLIVLYRLSPRRVTSTEALLLFGFGGAALWSSRMLVWWVPLASYFAVQHASAVWNTWKPSVQGEAAEPRSGRWTVITVGVAWIAFAVTPFGGELVRWLNSGAKQNRSDDQQTRSTEVAANKQPEAAASKTNAPSKSIKLEKLVSAQTPLGVVEHLKKLVAEKRLPAGQAFNTYEWGDYLLWAGPSELNVFVASHVHLVPREIWTDYVAISNGSDWEDRFDRYGINLVLLDEATHDGLIRRLRENAEWRMTYSDNVGSVFVRRKPI